jgi:hypothetical protein
MLTFEEKLAVIASFPALQRKDVSLGRVNFHYEASMLDKKIVVYHLHPNGNGFVYAEHIPRTAADDKGFVNIREYSAEDLSSLIQASILSLSGKASAHEAIPEVTQTEFVAEESWFDDEGQVLVLREEDELWNIYTGLNLEMAFETYKEAVKYLHGEGFTRD